MGESISRKMVDRKTAAAMFSMSAGTLGNWLSQGRGPRAYKVGRKILYRLEDLEEFFTRNPILTADSAEEVVQ